MMNKPAASVIIVARDEEDNIRRCLSAVREQETSFAFEMIVVDSGSRDRTGEVARSLGARVIAIAREDFQHGATRQMASLEARGDFLVYLVADAVPADAHWLERLVRAAADDERVAGAYSRQVPRPGAGPLEAHRLEHRASSGSERVVRRIAEEDDFWAWTPEQRFYFCEFDDVSCCRRRSLIERFPIPAVDWAEDLLWARLVLLAGRRIVFEPGSVVVHSHGDTLSHAFCRGWLDQAVVKRWFGVLYFDGVVSILRGYPVLWADQCKTVMASDLGVGRRLGLLGWNTARLLAEVAGNFMASRTARRVHVVHDLIPIMSRARGEGKALATRFTLGADTRPVLFMNPNAARAALLRVPEGARLEFGAAVNPAARTRRRAPVMFAAAINGEPVWWKEVGPGERGREPEWTEAVIDLAPWAGKKIRLAFITRAKNTDHAWAGWGAPGIVTERLTAWDRAVNRVNELAARRVSGEPLRHP